MGQELRCNGKHEMQLRFGRVCGGVPEMLCRSVGRVGKWNCSRKLCEDHGAV